MNKLIGIWYKFKLNNVDKELTKNADEIRDYCGEDIFSISKFKDDLKYNSLRSEQLKLMSCRSYLENKLTCITN